MVRALITSGNHEALKCGVHGAAGVLAGLMAAYNIAACCFRRDAHLRVNAVVYTLAVAWEVKQTLHHLRHQADAGQEADVVEFPPSARCGQ
jgi:hypothetical protein